MYNYLKGSFNSAYEQGRHERQDRQDLDITWILRNKKKTAAAPRR